MLIRNDSPSKTKEKFWKNADWKAISKYLSEIQHEIALAAKARNMFEVARLQGLIMQSLNCRAFAVRKISNSVAQAGIDGVKWATGAEKLDGALSLTADNYKAKPMKLIKYTPKGDHKIRHIHIPTAYDRAMQTVFALALDPVAESWGDRTSFAFRKRRSPFDCHAYIMKMLTEEPPPQFIVKADVKEFYGQISHKWLLKNIPMDTHVLNEFLECGHFFLGEMFPSDKFGITLGSSLSPILGNMTLDGLQAAVYNGLQGKRSKDNPYRDYGDGAMIRFADDMLFSAKTYTSAKKILAILKEFLACRGLTLSDPKTKIVNFGSGEDFDFLSRNYKYKNDFVYAKPSTGAVAELEESLRALILPWRKSQLKLIERINKKLIGWGSYHRVADATEAFDYVDCLVSALTYEATRKLYPRMKPVNVEERFFWPSRSGGKTFCLETNKNVHVYRLNDILLRVHRPLSITKNPYIDEEYFEKKTDIRAISYATGKYKEIFEGQDRECAYCGRPILADEFKVLVQVGVDTTDKHAKRLAYVHQVCTAGQFEYYKGDEPVETEYDLYAFLERLKGEKSVTPARDKFYLLTKYFEERNETVIALKFSDIEKILTFDLSKSLRTSQSYWSGHYNRMRNCWMSSGYRIRRVDLKKEMVTFEKFEDLGVAVYIPRVILEGRIPVNAAIDFRLMVAQLMKNYNITDE